jgi:hypothetical protein
MSLKTSFSTSVHSNTDMTLLGLISVTLKA